MSAHTGPIDGSLLYGIDARPPLREMLAVALRHVFAVLDTRYQVSMSLFVSEAANQASQRMLQA